MHIKYLFSLNDYRSVKLLLLTLIWTLFIIIWQEHDHGYVYLTIADHWLLQTVILDAMLSKL